MSGSDRDRRGPGARVAALGYRPDADTAPRVVARGRGDVATRILDAAREHGVPVQRDPDLLACLEAVELGAEVPPAAYAAVASLLAFVLEARDRFAPERDSRGADGLSSPP